LVNPYNKSDAFAFQVQAGERYGGGLPYGDRQAASSDDFSLAACFIYICVSIL